MKASFKIKSAITVNIKTTILKKMVGFVTILSENFKLKQSKRCEKNIFIIYSPEKETKFEDEEIQKIIGPTNGSKRLWINLLNESYFNKNQINKGDVIGYLVIEPEDIKVHYAKKEKPSRKNTKQPNNYLPKDWSKRHKS